MGKDHRTSDQKRKAKLAARARKQRNSADLTPYEGTKYQSSRWMPYVHSTEQGVFETIQLSQHRLTNKQVKEAFRTLIKQLHEGTSPVLAEDEPEMEFAKGDEVQFLVWAIRRHWTELFETQKPAGSADLIGILRTLLNSIDAHAWNTGPNKGYVAYLDSFMRRTGLSEPGAETISAEDLIRIAENDFSGHKIAGRNVVVLDEHDIHSTDDE